MMKSVLACVVMLASLTGGAAAAQELNTISKVEVSGDGQKTTVTLTGSRRATFQAYQQKAPVRVVVDLVKSQLKDVPASVAVPAGGVVKEIRSTQMGTAGRELARVEIIFESEVDYQMDTDGNALRLVATRRGKTAEQLLAEKAAKEEADRKAAEVARLEKEAAEKAALEKAEAERKAVELARLEKEAAEKAALQKIEAEKKAQEVARLEKEAAEKAALQKIEAEKKAQELARLEKEATEKAAREKAEAEKLARLEKEAADKAAKEQAAAEKLARAEKAEADKKAAEVARLEKAAADKAAREKADADKKSADVARAEKAAADKKAQELARAEQAAAENATAAERAAAAAERAATERKAAEVARAEKAENDRLQHMRDEVARAEAQKRDQQVAASSVPAARSSGSAADAPAAHTREDDGFGGGKTQAPAPAQKSKPVATQAAADGARAAEGDTSGAPRVLTFVGFKNAGEQSLIIVRTNDKVAYNVRKVGQGKVVLELENCRILLRNNQRVLDTSYFPRTAVKMVTPEEHEGASKTVKILVELSEDVPFEAKQENNSITVSFQRPAG